MPTRAARALLLALTLALAAAAAAGATSAPIRFAFLPKQAIQGDPATITVALRRATDRCTLAIAYAKGAPTPVATVAAQGGRAVWKWQVPKDVQAGAAQASVKCTRSGRIAGSLMIVGRVLPPKIDVVKTGFSIKVPRIGGSSVSYGVVLANESKTEDALDAIVLVNFVMADNRLIGSVTKRLKVVPAGGEYALGGSLTFPGAAPVDRLEVVVQVDGHRRHVDVPTPTLESLRILPGRIDPGYVGSVEGELINGDPRLTFTRATLTIVVFDAAGNVIGGGSGSVSASLPPGGREFFKATSGLTSIPMEKAASVQVTIDSLYAQTQA